MNDDAALLRRYADTRDEGAFAELVRRHLPLVYGAALRQLGGATHRAEEVAQSVFTDLARKAASLSHREDIVGWLYTSTHFAAAKLKRTEQRRQQREQEAHIMHELLSGPASADWERLRPVLDDAMHELGERERAVILQRFFQGQRFAEIAPRLGLSEDAARMRVERALEKLRALLAKREITSTTAALALALGSQPAVAVPAGLAAEVACAAVASGSGASAGAVGFFMSTTKVTAVIAGLVVLMGLGTATHEVMEQRHAEATAAAAKQELTRLDARVAEQIAHATAVEQEVADARQQFRAAQAAQAARAAAASGAARTAAGGGPPREAVAGGEAFMARHPEVERAVMDAYRAQMAAMFGAFYRARDWTPAQIEAFEAAMRHGAGVQRMVPAGDGTTFILSVPGWLDPDKRQQEEKQLLALIGREGVPQLQAAIQELPARQMAAQVATALAATPEALTTAQAEQLVQATAASLPSRASTGSTKINWDVLLEKARPILSEAQLATLVGLQAQERYQQELQAAISRAYQDRAAGKSGG